MENNTNNENKETTELTGTTAENEASFEGNTADFDRLREENFRALEAILFAAGVPVTYEKIAVALDSTAASVKQFAESVKGEYDGRGIELICYDDSCLLCTRAEYEQKIKTALDLRRSGTLSNSALEVLAIIARNQPVTRSYIEQVRGIDSTYTVGYLSDKGLIEAVGRLDVPGRPTLYATTEAFLRCFGISSLDELGEIGNL